MRSMGPEVAFIGRSNAGKSSLINAVLNRRDLAKTSKTPGRTRHAVVYGSVFIKEKNAAEMTLVDLPGFGFASMSKDEALQCEELIRSYVNNRKQLQAIVLAMDIRRSIGEREEMIISSAKKRLVPLLLVLTKSDKLSLAERKPSKMRISREACIECQSVLLHSINNENDQKPILEWIFKNALSVLA